MKRKMDLLAAALAGQSDGPQQASPGRERQSLRTETNDSRMPLP
jgi:hypothetical protein